MKTKDKISRRTLVFLLVIVIGLIIIILCHLYEDCVSDFEDCVITLEHYRYALEEEYNYTIADLNIGEFISKLNEEHKNKLKEEEGK